MQHPIEKLTFHEGEIYEFPYEQEPKSYLTTLEVKIVKKGSVKELDKNECSYRFILSTYIDEIWQSLFWQQFSEFVVQFEGNEMILNCIPANLEGRYKKIKIAIAQTNERYKKERESVISRVKAKDQERLTTKMRNAETKTEIKSQFDRLEL